MGKRLQVGSVDAFQGKEFDVIFLSVVRSGGDFQRVDLPYLERTGLAKGSAGYAEWEAYKEQTGKGLYGFLTSPNRLCVALCAGHEEPGGAVHRKGGGGKWIRF